MIIYGKQIFLYILDKHPSLIEEVFLAKEIDKKLFSKIKTQKKPIIKLDAKKAQAMAKGGNHQGFFMRIKDLDLAELQNVKKSAFLLVLHSVTDVGNIGAIIRSAYALGVEGVIISGVNSLAIEALIRSSSGAIFEMPIVHFQDTMSLINELKQSGFAIYAATIEGEDVRGVKFSQKKALVMGSEGKGLPERIVNRCDKKITIKMQREFDSLNVSAATAILCDRMR